MTSPTIDTQSLESLLERVRSATGPDREIEADLFRALGYAVSPPQKNYQKFVWLMHEPGGAWRSMLAVTESLDACAALQAEVLPGWNWVKTDDGSFAVLWRVTRFHNSDRLATECLTFLAAILSALIAKGGADV